MLLNCVKKASRYNLTFLQILIIFLCYLKFSLISTSNCWAQTAQQKSEKIKLYLTYNLGETYLLNEAQSHHRAKVNFEYYLSNSTSLAIAVSITDVTASKINCSSLEKGARNFAVEYLVNSIVLSNYNGILNFSTAFGGIFNNFKASDKYDLKGFSSLVATHMSIKIRKLIPYSNYEFLGLNNMKIGIFRGKVNNIHENNEIYFSCPHLSIDSGFIFPLFQEININISYQNEVLGNRISHHGCNIGITFNL